MEHFSAQQVAASDDIEVSSQGGSGVSIRGAAVAPYSKGTLWHLELRRRRQLHHHLYRGLVLVIWRFGTTLTLTLTQVGELI